MARTTEGALVILESAFELVEQPESPKIRAIQARNYRCLRHVDVRLEGRFYVAVGPNGSGKSTLFDAIEFLFDFFNGGLKAAIELRTQNYQDLVWARPEKGPGFELAAEFEVANKLFRYELRVGEELGRGVRIVREAGYLGHLTDEAFSDLARSGTVFSDIPNDVLRPAFRTERGRAAEDYRATFYSEKDGGTLGLHFPEDTSALRYVDLVHQFRAGRDNSKHRMFNMSTTKAVTSPLSERRVVQFLQLDSRALRKPAPRDGDDGSRLTEDGKNLPRVVENLSRDKARWDDWMEHIREVFPSIRNIRSVPREEERSDYLMIRYANGAEIPAWGISEGTLRMLALTILAYLPDEQPAAYLLEEPENGIHPMAIETAHESLSSIYTSQVFIASHSPTFLRCVEPREVLCFSRDEDGAAVIVRGDEHPKLAEWQGSTDDDVFFALDILG